MTSVNDKTVTVKKGLAVDKCLVNTVGYASAFKVPRGCQQIVSAWMVAIQ